MHELTGTLHSVTYTASGMPLITFSMEQRAETLKMADSLSGGVRATIKVNKYQEKRSLSANAYAWVLIDKLAARMNLTKTEVYRNAIREIGGVSETVCVMDKAVEKLRSGWEKNGIGWMTDAMPSKIGRCTNVILYYGSSTYTTEQMRRLIDCIIEDCEAVGIETKTPDEIADMLSRWSEYGG